VYPPVYRPGPLAGAVPFGQLGPRKSIFDPIHGVVVVRGPALELIGLPVFQRLWGIRQTGFAHLVFPGANHTRLEHSLGVYSVASSLADALDLSPEDRASVAVGGLLHDLGHAPLSHTLEPTMREVLGAGHEARSRAWITGARRSAPGTGPPLSDVAQVLERFDLDPGHVADLVDPPPRADRRPLLRELLHGPIDADRMDYLQRDAHYTGVAHGAIDAVRLLDTALIRDDHLVFAEKGRSAVEGFLVGRALMYASVYYHKTVRAAEVMAQAAVERLPGFPAAVAPLFDRTDGELLCDLANAGGLPQRLGRMLSDRRLYKRAWGLRTVPTDQARRYQRLARKPVERRAREDEIAGALGAEAGSVLFDLSGLDARSDPESDWAEVGLVEEDGAVSHPFRGPGAFRSLAVRPPTRWLASVYVRPELLADAQRALGGRIDPVG
jgi:HD superfamily phosphohydrolase